MKEFLKEDFLLTTPTAQELYDQVASTLPILDYHCHIDPKEIAEDRRFENITQVWLGETITNGGCCGPTERRSPG